MSRSAGAVEAGLWGRHPRPCAYSFQPGARQGPWQGSSREAVPRGWGRGGALPQKGPSRTGSLHILSLKFFKHEIG